MKKKGFFSNWIVKNLLIALILFVVLLGGSMVFLNLFTQHNKELSVPDFSNMTLPEAEILAEEAGVRVEVADSVFAKRMRKGAVRNQNPVPGAKVKKGRRVSLIINAMNAKKVAMPDLIGLSMRQAMAELQGRGLAVGNLIYVEDMATNNVLKQLKGNQEIKPGEEIDSDTVIDLVLGLNSATDATTYVPSVVGKRYMTAVDLVHKQSLNIRDLKFDSSVKDYADSANAVVYRQIPEPVILEADESDPDALPEVVPVPVKLGSNVTLYLTVDPEKIPEI